MPSSILTARTIGRRLRNERERLGLTRIDVAAATGVNRLTVYSYEKGIYPQPMDYIADVVAAGFDLGYLISGERILPTMPIDELSIESFMRIEKLVDEIGHDAKGRPLAADKRRLLVEHLSRLVSE